jgi:uncharacterized protein (TIGR03437 family)
LLLSGRGLLNGPAPWGDVAAETLSPAAPVEVFVGGRQAGLLSAELSRMEVGVVEVRAEVPWIASDTHPLSLRVAGVNVPAGLIVVR